MFLCVFLCFHPFGDFHGKDFPSVYNTWDVVLAKPHWLNFWKAKNLTKTITEDGSLDVILDVYDVDFCML